MSYDLQNLNTEARYFSAKRAKLEEDLTWLKRMVQHRMQEAEDLI